MSSSLDNHLNSLLNSSSGWNPTNTFAGTFLLCIMGLVLSTYVITSIRSTLAFWQKGESGKTPAISPYAIPIAGNLFAFAFDTMGYLTGLMKKYGNSMPVRIRVLNQKIYLISGASTVQALFRSSKDLTTVPSTILVLHNTFGWPKKDLHILHRDKSGVHAQPRAGAPKIEAHNRIYQLVHQTVHNGLSGSGLADLGPRFAKYLNAGLDELDIGDEWVEIPNFYHLIQTVAFNASVTALCGPHLLRLNPNFTADFWDYDSRMPYLFKNIPRLLIPKAYALRDKLKGNIQKWYAFAEKMQDPEAEGVVKLEWEEFYGAKVMRERIIGHKRIDGMTDEALAANDLGMIWAANANVIPLMGWGIIDSFIRPDVLERARAEVTEAIDSSSDLPMGLQFNKLFSRPLLQSINSEELRIRNGVIIQRVPLADDFTLAGFKFPKDRMIVASSWHEQRDRSVWNEGPVNGVFHSVEDFWADRFLVYPHDPMSGPRKPSQEAKSKTSPNVVDVEKNEPRYTLDSVAGSYIPYGGGAKICPGRFYAKQEALIGLALFITKFDVEFLGDKKFTPNKKFFPFGVVPPVGDFRVRMRRRKL